MKKILDDIRRDAIAKLNLSKSQDPSPLLDAALTTITLSTIARREGLLTLEEFIKNTESEFLKLIAALIIDGTDPDLVIEIAANEYWTNEPKGIQAMITYFYLRGFLHIQSGGTNQLLEKLLLSLIPSPWHTEYQKRLKTKKEQSGISYQKELLEKFTYLHPTFQDTHTLELISVLEKQVHTLPNPSIQRILREIEHQDLSLCVYALNEESRKKILNNLSNRIANLIIENIIYFRSVNEKDVAESLLKVLSILNQLCKTGEIYSPISSEKD